MPQDNKKKQSESPKFSWDQVVSLVNGLVNNMPSDPLLTEIQGLGSSQYVDRRNMQDAYMGQPDYPMPYYTPNMSSPEDALMTMESPMLLSDRMLPARLSPGPSDYFRAITPQEKQKMALNLAAMQKLGSLERAGRPQYLRPEDQQY